MGHGSIPDGEGDAVADFAEHVFIVFGVCAGSILHVFEMILLQFSSKLCVDFGIFDGFSFKLEAVAILKDMNNITVSPIVRLLVWIVTTDLQISPFFAPVIHGLI